MALPMMGANDKVNVAVVGVGGRGSAHVKEYLTIPSARIARALRRQHRGDRAQRAGGPQSARRASRKIYQDLRKLYEDKDIDAVSIATPNHWHALATIWACQAGKDVYVREARQLQRLRRPADGRRRRASTTAWCRSGCRAAAIGYKTARHRDCCTTAPSARSTMAKGLCFKRRPSIGHAADEPVPPGVDWDMFLGPAPMRPFNATAVQVQLALVLGHGQRRHRQPGRS